MMSWLEATRPKLPNYAQPHKGISFSWDLAIMFHIFVVFALWYWPYWPNMQCWLDSGLAFDSQCNEEMGVNVKKILKAKSNFNKDPPGTMSSRAAFPPLSSNKKGCDDIALRTKFFPPFSRLLLPLKSFQSQIADAREIYTKINRKIQNNLDNDRRKETFPNRKHPKSSQPKRVDASGNFVCWKI